MVKRVTRRSSAAPSAETDQPLQLDTYSYGLRTRSTEVDLMMECEEEELSDVQLAAIQRAQADHDKANQLIMEARQGRKMVPASQPNTFNILPHTEARSVNPSNMEKMETSSNADVILISESPPPAKTSPQVMTKLMTSLGNVTPQQVYKFVQGPMNQPPSISNGQWIIRPLVSVTPQKHGGHQAIMTTMGLQQPQVLSIPFQSSTTPLTAAKQGVGSRPLTFPCIPVQTKYRIVTMATHCGLEKTCQALPAVGHCIKCWRRRYFPKCQRSRRSLRRIWKRQWRRRLSECGMMTEISVCKKNKENLSVWMEEEEPKGADVSNRRSVWCSYCNGALHWLRDDVAECKCDSSCFCDRFEPNLHQDEKSLDNDTSANDFAVILDETTGLLKSLAEDIARSASASANLEASSHEKLRSQETCFLKDRNVESSKSSPDNICVVDVNSNQCVNDNEQSAGAIKEHNISFSKDVSKSGSTRDSRAGSSTVPRTSNDKPVLTVTDSVQSSCDSELSKKSNSCESESKPCEHLVESETGKLLELNLPSKNPGFPGRGNAMKQLRYLNDRRATSELMSNSDSDWSSTSSDEDKKSRLIGRYRNISPKSVKPATPSHEKLWKTKSSRTASQFSCDQTTRSVQKIKSFFESVPSCFTDQIVMLSRNFGVTEVCRRLHIPKTQLLKWRRRFKELDETDALSAKTVCQSKAEFLTFQQGKGMLDEILSKKCLPSLVNRPASRLYHKGRGEERHSQWETMQSSIVDPPDWSDESLSWNNSEDEDETPVEESTVCSEELHPSQYLHGKMIYLQTDTDTDTSDSSKNPEAILDQRDTCCQNANSNYVGSNYSKVNKDFQTATAVSPLSCNTTRNTSKDAHLTEESSVSDTSLSFHISDFEYCVIPVSVPAQDQRESDTITGSLPRVELFTEDGDELQITVNLSDVEDDKLVDEPIEVAGSDGEDFDEEESIPISSDTIQNPQLSIAHFFKATQHTTGAESVTVECKNLSKVSECLTAGGKENLTCEMQASQTCKQGLLNRKPHESLENSRMLQYYNANSSGTCASMDETTESNSFCKLGRRVKGMEDLNSKGIAVTCNYGEVPENLEEVENGQVTCTSSSKLIAQRTEEKRNTSQSLPMEDTPTVEEKCETSHMTEDGVDNFFSDTETVSVCGYGETDSDSEDIRLLDFNVSDQEVDNVEGNVSTAENENRSQVPAVIGSNLSDSVEIIAQTLREHSYFSFSHSAPIVKGAKRRKAVQIQRHFDDDDSEVEKEDKSLSNDVYWEPLPRNSLALAFEPEWTFVEGRPVPIYKNVNDFKQTLLWCIFHDGPEVVSSKHSIPVDFLQSVMDEVTSGKSCDICPVQKRLSPVKPGRILESVVIQVRDCKKAVSVAQSKRKNILPADQGNSRTSDYHHVNKQTDTTKLKGKDIESKRSKEQSQSNGTSRSDLMSMVVEDDEDEERNRNPMDVLSLLKEFDIEIKKDKRSRPIYTDAIKESLITLAKKYGVSTVSNRFNVSKGTIQGWLGSKKSKAPTLSIGLKTKLLILAQHNSYAMVASMYGIPKRTIRGWRRMIKATNSSVSDITVEEMQELIAYTEANKEKVAVMKETVTSAGSGNTDAAANRTEPPESCPAIETTDKTRKVAQPVPLPVPVDKIKKEKPESELDIWSKARQNTNQDPNDIDLMHRFKLAKLADKQSAALVGHRFKISSPLIRQWQKEFSNVRSLAEVKEMKDASRGKSDTGNPAGGLVMKGSPQSGGVNPGSTVEQRNNVDAPLNEQPARSSTGQRNGSLSSSSSSALSTPVGSMSQSSQNPTASSASISQPGTPRVAITDPSNMSPDLDLDKLRVKYPEYIKRKLAKLADKIGRVAVTVKYKVKTSTVATWQKKYAELQLSDITLTKTELEELDEIQKVQEIREEKRNEFQIYIDNPELEEVAQQLPMNFEEQSESQDFGHQLQKESFISPDDDLSTISSDSIPKVADLENQNVQDTLHLDTREDEHLQITGLSHEESTVKETMESTIKPPSFAEIKENTIKPPSFAEIKENTIKPPSFAEIKENTINLPSFAEIKENTIKRPSLTEAKGSTMKPSGKTKAGSPVQKKKIRRRNVDVYVPPNHNDVSRDALTDILKNFKRRQSLPDGVFSQSMSSGEEISKESASQLLGKTPIYIVVSNLSDHNSALGLECAEQPSADLASRPITGSPATRMGSANVPQLGSSTNLAPQKTGSLKKDTHMPIVLNSHSDTQQSRSTSETSQQGNTAAVAAASMVCSTEANVASNRPTNFSSEILQKDEQYSLHLKLKVLESIRQSGIEKTLECYDIDPALVSWWQKVFDPSSDSDINVLVRQAMLYRIHTWKGGLSLVKRLKAFEDARKAYLLSQMEDEADELLSSVVSADTESASQSVAGSPSADKPNNRDDVSLTSPLVIDLSSPDAGPTTSVDSSAVHAQYLSALRGVLENKTQSSSQSQLDTKENIVVLVDGDSDVDHHVDDQSGSTGHQDQVRPSKVKQEKSVNNMPTKLWKQLPQSKQEQSQMPMISSDPKAFQIETVGAMPKISYQVEKDANDALVTSTWKQVQGYYLLPSKVKQRKYTPEYKAKIVRLCNEKGQKVISRELKVPYNKISRWRLKAKTLDKVESQFQGKPAHVSSNNDSLKIKIKFGQKNPEVVKSGDKKFSSSFREKMVNYAQRHGVVLTAKMYHVSEHKLRDWMKTKAGYSASPSKDSHSTEHKKMVVGYARRHGFIAAAKRFVHNHKSVLEWMKEFHLLILDYHSDDDSAMMDSVDETVHPSMSSNLQEGHGILASILMTDTDVLPPFKPKSPKHLGAGQKSPLKWSPRRSSPGRSSNKGHSDDEFEELACWDAEGAPMSNSEDDDEPVLEEVDLTDTLVPSDGEEEEKEDGEQQPNSPSHAVVTKEDVIARHTHGLPPESGECPSLKHSQEMKKKKELLPTMALSKKIGLHSSEVSAVKFEPKEPVMSQDEVERLYKESLWQKLLDSDLDSFFAEPVVETKATSKTRKAFYLDVTVKQAAPEPQTVKSEPPVKAEEISNIEEKKPEEVLKDEVLKQDDSVKSEDTSTNNDTKTQEKSSISLFENLFQSFGHPKTEPKAVVKTEVEDVAADAVLKPSEDTGKPRANRNLFEMLDTGTIATKPVSIPTSSSLVSTPDDKPIKENAEQPKKVPFKSPFGLFSNLMKNIKIPFSDKLKPKDASTVANASASTVGPVSTKDQDSESSTKETSVLASKNLQLTTGSVTSTLDKGRDIEKENELRQTSLETHHMGEGNLFDKLMSHKPCNLEVKGEAVPQPRQEISTTVDYKTDTGQRSTKPQDPEQTGDSEERNVFSMLVTGTEKALQKDNLQSKRLKVESAAEKSVVENRETKPSTPTSSAPQFKFPKISFLGQIGKGGLVKTKRTEAKMELDSVTTVGDGEDSKGELDDGQSRGQTETAQAMNSTENSEDSQSAVKADQGSTDVDKDAAKVADTETDVDLMEDDPLLESETSGAPREGEEEDELYKSFDPQKIILILDISKKHGIEFASISFGIPTSVIVNWIIQKDRKQRKTKFTYTLEEKLRAVADVNSGMTAHAAALKSDTSWDVVIQWQAEVGWLIHEEGVPEVMEKWENEKVHTNICLDDNSESSIQSSTDKKAKRKSGRSGNDRKRSVTGAKSMTSKNVLAEADGSSAIAAAGNAASTDYQSTPPSLPSILAFARQKPPREFTVEEKAMVVLLGDRFGVNAVNKRLGINTGTIWSWKRYTKSVKQHLQHLNILKARMHPVKGRECSTREPSQAVAMDTATGQSEEVNNGDVKCAKDQQSVQVAGSSSEHTLNTTTACEDQQTVPDGQNTVPKASGSTETTEQTNRPIAAGGKAPSKDHNRIPDSKIPPILKDIDVKTLKRKDYSMEQRATVVRLVRLYGVKTIHKQFRIPSGSIWNWQHSKLVLDLISTKKTLRKTKGAAVDPEGLYAESELSEDEDMAGREAGSRETTGAECRLSSPEGIPTEDPVLSRCIKITRTDRQRTFSTDQKADIVMLIDKYGLAFVINTLRLPRGTVWNWQHNRYVLQLIEQKKQSAIVNTIRNISKGLALIRKKDDRQPSADTEIAGRPSVDVESNQESFNVKKARANRTQAWLAACQEPHLGQKKSLKRKKGKSVTLALTSDGPTPAKTKPGVSVMSTDTSKCDGCAEQSMDQSVDSSDAEFSNCSSHGYEEITNDSDIDIDKCFSASGTRGRDESKHSNKVRRSSHQQSSLECGHSTSTCSSVSDTWDDFEEVVTDIDLESETSSITKLGLIAGVDQLKPAGTGSRKSAKDWSSDISSSSATKNDADWENSREPDCDRASSKSSGSRGQTGSMSSPASCGIRKAALSCSEDFNQVHSGQRIAGTYGLGIRTSEPINSLPINSPPATVAKKKKGTANESEKDSSNWVPLDEYYYGKKEGDPQYSESKEEYRFKCWYCSKMLYNNVRTMQHIQGHIDSSKQQNIDLSDLTQCKQCYKQFDTPFEMQSHLEKVHLSNQVLMCRICEKDQATHRDLRQHMRVHHVACEMPYVCQLCNFKSSMYSDVVDHFKKKHDSSQHLLCLYCLRSFNVKFVSQGWGQTQTYYGHLLKHQSKSSTRKCGICRLTFFNPQDVKQHRKNNHLPNKGVIGSSSSSFTLDSVMIKVNDSGLPTKTNKLKSLNAPSVSKVEDIGGVRLPNAVNDLFCFECRMSMGSNDHYKKHINCSMCRFATSCSVAYANHMMGFHSGQMSSMNLNIPWERQLPQPMYCPCGFSSRYGNRIANHLAFCTSGVCFSSMQESPDTSKSFGAISIDEAEKTSESSIILDVLGLMKKSALTSYAGDSSSGTCSHKGRRLNSYSVSFKLKVIEYAKKNSNIGASKEYNVARKRVIEWRKAEKQLSGIEEQKDTKRLAGGGRKVKFLNIEEKLVDWIQSRRQANERVTGRTVKMECRRLHRLNGSQDFKASCGWLRSFMNRNTLSFRGRATRVAQPRSDVLDDKVQNFLKFVVKMRKLRHYELRNIGNMDETPIWVDMPGNFTSENEGTSTITMDTTGHEKSRSRIRVMLAAMADGTKLPPMVLLKGDCCPAEIPSGIIVKMTPTAWASEDVILCWLNQVWGQSAEKRLIVWDYLKGHITPGVRDQVKTKFNSDMAVIPCGTTSKLQPCEVSWKRHFKDRFQDLYEEWIVSGPLDLTIGGNRSAPDMSTLLGWIDEAWASVLPDVIRKSFSVTGITLALDGSEDQMLFNVSDNEEDKDPFEGFSAADVETSAQYGFNVLDGGEHYDTSEQEEVEGEGETSAQYGFNVLDGWEHYDSSEQMEQVEKEQGGETSAHYGFKVLDGGKPMVVDGGKPMVVDGGKPMVVDGGKPMVVDGGKPMVVDGGKPMVVDGGKPMVVDGGKPMVVDGGKPMVVDGGKPMVVDGGKPMVVDGGKPMVVDGGKPMVVDGGKPMVVDGGKPMVVDGGKPMVVDGGKPMVVDGGKPMVVDGGKPMVVDGGKPMVVDGGKPMVVDGGKPMVVDGGKPMDTCNNEEQKEEKEGKASYLCNPAESGSAKEVLSDDSTKNTARRSSTGKFLKKSLLIKSTIETKTTEANDAKKSETSPLARSMLPARARLSLMDSDRKLLKTKTLLAGTVGKADAEKVDELEKHNDLQMSSTSRAHRTKYVSILQSDKNAKNIKVEVSPEKDKYQVKTVVLGSDQSAELNKESEITVAKQSKDEKGEETEEPMTEEIAKVDQPMTDGDTKIDLPKEDKDLELNPIKSEKDSICDQPMEKDDLKSDQAMEKDDLKSDQAMEKDDLKSDQALKKDDFKSDQAVEKDDFKSDQAMEKDDFKSDQAVEKDDFKSDQAMEKDDLKSDQAMEKDDLESEHLTEVKETKPTESKKQEIDVKPVTEMEVVEEHSSDAAELQSSDSLLNTDTQSSSENQTQAKPVEIDDQSATTTQPQQIAQSETRYQQKDDSEGGTEIAVETETDEIEDVTVEKPTEGPSDSVDVNKKMEESIDPQSSSVGPQFSSKDAQSSSMESEQMTEDILSGEEGSEAEEEDRNAAHGMEEGGDSQPKGGNSKGPVTSSPITSASETEKETAMQSEEKLSSSFTKGESQPSVDDQQSQDSSTQSRQHGRERLMDKTDHSSVDGTHGRSFHRQQEPDRDREHHYRHDNRQSLGDRQHQRDRDQLGDRQHQRERDQHGGYSKHRYDDRDRSFDRDRDYRDRGDYGRDRDRSNEHNRGRRYHQDNRGHPGRYQGQGYGSQGNDGDQRQGGPSRDQDRNRGYQQRGGGNQNYRGGYRGGYY